MDISQFVPSFIWSQTFVYFSFQFGVTMNEAALNPAKSLCEPMFSLFEGKYLELPCHKDNCVSNG